MAQIISRRVGAVFGEFLAEAEVGRAVEAGHEAVDNRFRDKVKRGDACQYRGIQKALHHASLGRGTCSTRRFRISSVSMESDSAWKFNRTR